MVTTKAALTDKRRTDEGCANAKADLSRAIGGKGSIRCARICTRSGASPHHS
jgi:hypothetical protein